MISLSDSHKIQIRKDGDGRYSLTCHSLQVPVLEQMWSEYDFPLYEIRDSGLSGTQVTIVFGSGDPIDLYQQALDTVQDHGLIDSI